MRRKLTVFFIVSLVLILGIVLLYNFATSQYCIKNILIPTFFDKTGIKLSADKIKIAPLTSTVILDNLIFDSPQASVHSEKFSLKVNFYDIIFNKEINVDELLLKNTDITVKNNLSSSSVVKVSNIDSNNINREVFSEQKSKKKRSAKSLSRKEFFKITAKNVNIENLNISIDNNGTVTKISNFNLSIPNIEATKECTISMNSNIWLSDSSKTIKGAFESKSSIIFNDIFLPMMINSESTLELDGKKIPVDIKLKTSDDGSFVFSTVISDIFLKQFASAFISGPYNNLEGEIGKIALTASGDDIEKLCTAKNPVNVNIVINNADINSEGHFYVHNKNIDLNFNLGDLDKKDSSRLERIFINEFSAQYTKSLQSFKIENLNASLNKINNNEYEGIIKTLFGFTKDNKNIQGSIQGNLEAETDSITDLKSADFISELEIDGHKIPVKLSYLNNNDNEVIRLNAKNFDIESIRNFLDSSLKDLKAAFDDINICITGKGKNSVLEGLQKRKDSAVDAKITLKGLELIKKDIYDVKIPDFKAKFDLQSLINGKLFVDLIHINNPHIKYISKTKAELEKNNHKNLLIPQEEKSSIKQNEQPIGLEQSNKKETDVNFDFDIKDLVVKNMFVELITSKKIVVSDVNIKSEQIKTNVLSNIDLDLNYLIEGNLKGTLHTNNDVIINSALKPGLFKSRIILSSDKFKSISNIDLKLKAENSFELKTKINKLLLDGFLKTFAPSPYNTAKTMVNSLFINLTGQNFNDIKTFNGNVIASLRNISIPANVGNEDIIDAVFFPLRVIADMASNTALRFVSGNIANAMIKIDNAFNRNKKIEFQKGGVNFKLKSGAVNINNFDLYGTQDNPIEEIRVKGLVDLNSKKLDLDTNTRFAGLKIPLKVRGDLKKPKADTTEMTALILQKNSDTIIKTGMDVTNTVNETIKNIKNKNFHELLKPQEDGDNNSGNNMKQNQGSVKQNDTVNQIFGIINNVVNTGNQNAENNDSEKAKELTPEEKTAKQIINLFNF